MVGREAEIKIGRETGMEVGRDVRKRGKES